jgi:hypothetical protein
MNRPKKRKWWRCSAVGGGRGGLDDGANQGARRGGTEVTVKSRGIMHSLSRTAQRGPRSPKWSQRGRRTLVDRGSESPKKIDRVCTRSIGTFQLRPIQITFPAIRSFTAASPFFCGHVRTFTGITSADTVLASEQPKFGTKLRRGPKGATRAKTRANRGDQGHSAAAYAAAYAAPGSNGPPGRGRTAQRNLLLNAFKLPRWYSP